MLTSYQQSAARHDGGKATATHIHTIPRDTLAQAMYLGAFVRRKAREHAAWLTNLPIQQRRYAAVTGAGRLSPRGWVYLTGETA